MDTVEQIDEHRRPGSVSADVVPLVTEEPIILSFFFFFFFFHTLLLTADLYRISAFICRSCVRI